MLTVSWQGSLLRKRHSASAVQRTVWDGASEVAEIRARRDTSVAATEEPNTGWPLLPEGGVGDPNPY